MSLQLKAQVLNYETTLQDLRPAIARLNNRLENQQLQSSLAVQAEEKPPCSHNLLAASDFVKFLQTMAEPTAISGRVFRYINFRTMAFCFRGGYLVIQKWTPEGQRVYYISRPASGYGVEISVKISDCWTTSLKLRMTCSRIVQRTDEVVIASATGDTVKLQQLFSGKHAWPRDTLPNGYSLIHIAAIKNQTSVVQLLLEHGADSDATTNTGDTPLHLAVRAKVDFNLARTLLNHGADISCLNNRKRTPLHAFFSPIISQLALHSPESMNAITTDASGMTLAHYFSWTHQSSPTDFQFPNISTHLRARDAAGRTPLHFASQRGNIPVMQYLLSQYQYPARMQPDNQGNTALHEAVQSSRAPAALALLLMHGFSLKQRNNGGHTPAQYAVLWGTVAATEMLLDSDPGVGEGKRGLVALARRTENVDVEAWLLGRGSGKEDEDEDENRGRDELGDMGQIDFARVGGWRVIGETMVMFLVTITIVYRHLLLGVLILLPYLFIRGDLIS
ncbi:MAG: hypothetical protein Q9172_004773 [Xanthocarpia lactea]